MKKLKPTPKFDNSSQENNFWQSHDSTDYINWGKAKLASFPNLKPSVKIISLRIPETLLNEIKILANKKDVPYQSLIKIMLSHEINILRHEYQT